MKPGIRTSEFWVMVLAAVLTELNSLLSLNLSVEQTAVIWGPAIAYIISRGLAKWGGSDA